MPGGGSPKLSITVNNKTIVGMICVGGLVPRQGKKPTHIIIYFDNASNTLNFSDCSLCVVGGGVVVFVRCWAFHKP
ncbi:hypothetical protein N24_1501 [Corynebacterium suranareeae]|uniref:Uncharacterized protein n=1 Tax=Corynebacterium suranareeae TaxID=2506452 RepID=A0A160PRM5_9CORY|nr:hypothetical protein N24_1501 [Corynebacterium suranareeae]